MNPTASASASAATATSAKAASATTAQVDFPLFAIDEVAVRVVSEPAQTLSSCSTLSATETGDVLD